MTDQGQKPQTLLVLWDQLQGVAYVMFTTAKKLELAESISTNSIPCSIYAIQDTVPGTKKHRASRTLPACEDTIIFKLHCQVKRAEYKII